MSFSIPSLRPFTTPITIASAASASTLLLHFDGTDGATSTTDSSLNSVAITFNKTGTSTSFPALRTGTKKFTTGSSLSNISGAGGDGPGYISFPNSSLFNLASQDWTIDFWWYPTINLPSATSASSRFTILSNNYTDSTLTYGLVLFNASFYTGGSDLGLSISSDGSTNTITNATIGTNAFATANTWYHVAIERYGSNINGYVNGTYTNVSSTFSSSIYYNAAAPWAFSNGSRGAYNAANQISSYCDELRIVNGTALYRGSSFTPPSSPYTS